MKTAIKYIALSIALFIFASLFAYLIFQWLRVSHIEIQIEKNFSWDSSVNQIRLQVQEKLKPYIGKRIKDIALEKLIDIVKTDPRVNTVGIVRLLPHHLLVQIQIKKPLLVLLDKKSYMHPISIDGTLLPALKPKHAPDLPIVRGTVFFKQKSLRKLAISFIQKLPKDGLFSAKAISEIHYLPAEDSLYFVLDQNGNRIMVGSKPEQIKVGRIKSVLQYLSQQHIKWRVIDVRFSQKIVVSTR